MRTVTRRPQWTVLIQRPDYNQSRLSYTGVPAWSRTGLNVRDLRFKSNSTSADTQYNDLISYEYDNQLKDPQGAFSLTFVPSLDGNGLSWKDKIQKRDIVYIEEFGKVRYIGIVGQSTYTMTLANEKPNRAVSVSGVSIGGMLQSFNIPMNIYLWRGGGTADIKNQKFINALNSAYNEGDNLNSVFKLIKDGFFDVNFGGASNGFKAIIDKFFDIDASSLFSRYPTLLKPFQQDNNTLWRIMRQILPEPIYEIYGRYNRNKYEMICREVPFDIDKWSRLKLNTIDPAHLIDQNLSESDQEIYTHYNSDMPNTAIGQYESYASLYLDQTSVFDNDLLPIYGYRELTATFPFFNISKFGDFDSIRFLKSNSLRLWDWYHNNGDFQSGSITLHSVPDQDNLYPDIGERLGYLKGAAGDIEFYIESVKRKMTYPGNMTSTYSITRGFEYGSKQVTVDGFSFFTAQVQKITGLGIKLYKAEKEAVK